MAIFLIAYSTPQLLAIFSHSEWFAVGVLFEASADCDIEFHLSNEMKVLADVSASGALRISWVGDEKKCSKMRFQVPGTIRSVEAYRSVTDEQGMTENKLVRISAEHNSFDFTIDPNTINNNVIPRDDPSSHGFIRIAFDDVTDVIKPVSYTKSVTNFLVRSSRLAKSGESPDDFLKHYVPAAKPVMKSKVQFPGRFIVSEAFVANPQAVSLILGQSEMSWDGAGVLYFDDMDQSERKDLVILIDGILLATGLSMLVELACKLAEHLS